MNVSEHLSIVALREGLFLANGVQSRGQNRIREIRPSGIVGGLAETWAKGAGLRAMGKPVVQPPNPMAARAAFYPDNRTSRLSERAEVGRKPRFSRLYGDEGSVMGLERRGRGILLWQGGQPVTGGAA